MSGSSNDFEFSNGSVQVAENTPQVRSKAGKIIALAVVCLLPVLSVFIVSAGVTGSVVPAFLSLIFIPVGVIALVKNAKAMRSVSEKGIDLAGPELQERDHWVKIFLIVFALICVAGLLAAVVIPGLSTYHSST